MACYKPTKCPHCGKRVESDGEGISSSFGTPAAMCYHCGKTYQTGKHYWKEMPREEKIFIYGRILLGGVIPGFFVFAVLALGLISLLENQVGLEHSFPRNRIIAIIVAPLALYVGALPGLLHLRKLKELTKENDPDEGLRQLRELHQWQEDTQNAAALGQGKSKEQMETEMNRILGIEEDEEKES